MKRTKSVSKELFIRDLERPTPASGPVTTLAIGEEACKGCKGGKETGKQK